MTMPFENDTNSIIRKIASAQLRHDKLKKGVAVLAIALSAFLMSAVLLLSFGIVTMNMNGGNSITGSYHALVSGITEEQYYKLSADSRIKLLGFNAPVGSIKTDDKRLNVSCSNQECLILNGLLISEGRMPVQKNEILIEEAYLRSQKLDAGIGDTISLPITGSQENMDFVISGYLETSAKGTSRTLYAAIVSLKYFEETNGWNTLAASAMFRINSNVMAKQEDIKNTAMQISSDAGIKQTPSINEAFIKLSQPSVFMIAAAVAGLAIVIMAGILVIYSIFYISIINSMKEYGQLRTIGMTAKQIKRLVFRQGFSLTRTAIPAGMTAGILFSYMLMPQGFRWNHILWVCPVVVVLVSLTVSLSIRKPAKMAASVSPIEAARYENSDAAHAHKHRKLTPYALARGQILRYRKKNIITLASLTLTGVLLLGLSSVLSSVNAREMSLSGFERGQFFVAFRNYELREHTLEQAQSNSPFTDELYYALRSLSGLEEMTVYQYLPVSNDLQARESDAAIAGFCREDMRLLQSCAFPGTDLDYEKMASRKQLIVGRADDFEQYFGEQPEAGAFVTLKIFDGERRNEMQFEIAAVLDQSKIGNNGDKIDMLLLPAASMREIAHSNLTYQYAVRVDDKFEQQAEKEIEEILTNHPRLNVVTLSAAIAQNENFLQGTQLALMAAIVFIGCFSVMNLLNTILTGIIVRRKEFALMRSVGMSQKQLSAMVRCEGLLVVSAGLSLSLIAGGGMGYLLCSFLKSSFMTYLEYRFPYGITMIYCLIVFLCTAAIIGGALKYMNKFSAVELLRK